VLFGTWFTRYGTPLPVRCCSLRSTCKVQADGKNLHGAALTSFAKKCCNDQAAAQKLHGAAKTSFTKKCLSDATGV